MCPQCVQNLHDYVCESVLVVKSNIWLSSRNQALIDR